MLAKFGLVILTLVFGVAAFCAGLVAPASYQQSAAHAWHGVQQQIQALLNAGGSTARSSVAQLVTPAPAPTSSSAPATAASATAPTASASAPAAIPAASLLLTGAPSPGTQYTLQAAQYPGADSASAKELSQRISAQGVPSSVLPKLEPDGSLTSVVTVGQFSNADAALAQRLALSLRLGLPAHMRPLALVPPPKPAPP